jgi:tRNA(Ile2)-agmatinylcytidine synthase
MTGIYIGIDDTDSSEGMCTTYLAVLLIEKLGLDLIGYPRLVRLNPNIPWKTRGNGAICLKFGKGTGSKFLVGNIKGKKVYAYSSSKQVLITSNLLDSVKELVEKYAIFRDPNTNPGIVISSKRVDEKIYWSAVRSVLNIGEVEKKISDTIYQKYKNGRGIIGASAAIAWRARHKTHELITYLNEKQWLSPRTIKTEEVIELDKKLTHTFNNYDYENKHISIKPNSKTPVLYGVRGTDPRELLKSLKILTAEFESFLIYETNQGTDDHIVPEKIGHIKEYESVMLTGTVTSLPKIIKGGHMLFELTDNTGTITCAAYEPTKEFREIIKNLVIGDELKLFGGKRKEESTINIEKIKILKLRKIEKNVPPLCPVCHKKMDSIGKDKGYRCKKCGTKSFDFKKIELSRPLKPGYYEVPVLARRHLSKPLKLIAQSHSLKSR